MKGGMSLYYQHIELNARHLTETMMKLGELDFTEFLVQTWRFSRGVFFCRFFDGVFWGLTPREEEDKFVHKYGSWASHDFLSDGSS